MPKPESAEQRAKRLRREMLAWIRKHFGPASENLLRAYLSRLLRAEREAAAERAIMRFDEEGGVALSGDERHIIYDAILGKRRKPK